jgi:hypothetical protein
MVSRASEGWRGAVDVVEVVLKKCGNGVEGGKERKARGGRETVAETAKVVEARSPNTADRHLRLAIGHQALGVSLLRFY